MKKNFVMLCGAACLLCGCSTGEQLAKGISEKTISGSGAVVYSRAGLDHQTQTPELVTVFVCVYFALAAYATTALMKEPLTYFLVQARADGTLTAEEGLRPQPEEDEDE